MYYKKKLHLGTELEIFENERLCLSWIAELKEVFKVWIQLSGWDRLLYLPPLLFLSIYFSKVLTGAEIFPGCVLYTVPKNNLNLGTKTEPVTNGAAATVLIYYPAFIYICLSQKADIYCTVLLHLLQSWKQTRFNVKISGIFGTVYWTLTRNNAGNNLGNFVKYEQ